MSDPVDFDRLVARARSAGVAVQRRGQHGPPADKARRAEQLLRVDLARGPVLFSVLLAHGKRNGLSESALRRARKVLKVESVMLGLQVAWQLPPTKSEEP